MRAVPFLAFLLITTSLLHAGRRELGFQLLAALKPQGIVSGRSGETTRDKITRLIGEGADLSVHDDLDGSTPLHWAAQEAPLSVVTLIRTTMMKRQQGDLLYARDNDGMTALHWAVIAGRHIVSNYLACEMVGHEPVDNHGIRPFDLAVNQKNPDFELATLVLHRDDCMKIFTREKNEAGIAYLNKHYPDLKARNLEPWEAYREERRSFSRERLDVESGFDSSGGDDECCVMDQGTACSLFWCGGCVICGLGMIFLGATTRGV